MDEEHSPESPLFLPLPSSTAPGPTLDSQEDPLVGLLQLCCGSPPPSPTRRCCFGWIVAVSFLLSVGVVAVTFDAYEESFFISYTTISNYSISIGSMRYRNVSVSTGAVIFDEDGQGKPGSGGLHLPSSFQSVANYNLALGISISIITVLSTWTAVSCSTRSANRPSPMKLVKVLALHSVWMVMEAVIGIGWLVVFLSSYGEITAGAVTRNIEFGGWEMIGVVSTVCLEAVCSVLATLWYRSSKWWKEEVRVSSLQEEDRRRYGVSIHVLP